MHQHYGLAGFPVKNVGKICCWSNPSLSFSPSIKYIKEYKSPRWLLPGFVCAFAVSLRSSAVRENTQGFILLSPTSERKLPCWAELQCYHTTGTCWSLLPYTAWARWVSASAGVINERESDEGTQAIPLATHLCDTHEGEWFCLMHSHAHPHQTGVL